MRASRHPDRHARRSSAICCCDGPVALAFEGSSTLRDASPPSRWHAAFADAYAFAQKSCCPSEPQHALRAPAPMQLPPKTHTRRSIPAGARGGSPDVYQGAPLPRS
eukprot:5542988-Prymnesium_polylepis.3